MLTHKQQYNYIYSKQEVSRGQNEGNLEGRRCRCRSVSDETSETTNMLLPTFHAQFSRETTKPKTQPGWLAGTYGTPSCLQGFKKTVFFSLLFFPLYFSLFRENGTIFQMLNYIVVVQFVTKVLSTHGVCYKKKLSTFYYLMN